MKHFHLTNGMRLGPYCLVALLLLAACATLSKPWTAPEIRPLGLRPAELRADRQSFLLNLLVKNPNDRTLPIKAMTYRLSLDGSEIASGASALERQIPAFGEETVDLEVNGNLMSLISRIPSLALGGRDLEWKIAGTVTVADGLLTLPYRYSGTVSPQTLMSAAFGRL